MWLEKRKTLDLPSLFRDYFCVQWPFGLMVLKSCHLNTLLITLKPIKAELSSPKWIKAVRGINKSAANIQLKGKGPSVPITPAPWNCRKKSGPGKGWLRGEGTCNMACVTLALWSCRGVHIFLHKCKQLTILYFKTHINLWESMGTRGWWP